MGRATDAASWRCPNQTLLIVLDGLDWHSEHTKEVLQTILWAANNAPLPVFEIFVSSKNEHFCPFAFFVVLKHFKLAGHDLNRNNFTDQFFFHLGKKLDATLTLLAASPKTDNPLPPLATTNSLDFVFFLLFDCSEFIGYTKSFPTDALCSVFLKIFGKMEQLRQITFVTRMSHLVKTSEKRFPSLVAKLKNFLLSLYLDNFGDQEIRTLLGHNLIGFIPEVYGAPHERLLDFYLTKYVRRYNTFRLTDPDLLIFDRTIRALTDKNGSKLMEVATFFETLSLSFGWQFTFFHPIYLYFVERFWGVSGVVDKQLMLYWEHFFTRTLDCALNILKGKKNEFDEQLRLEFVPNIRLLKAVLELPISKQLREKGVVQCGKIEGMTVEYAQKQTRRSYYGEFEHNQFFKAICELVGYKLGGGKTEAEEVATESPRTPEGQQEDQAAAVPLPLAELPENPDRPLEAEPESPPKEPEAPIPEQIVAERPAEIRSAVAESCESLVGARISDSRAQVDQNRSCFGYLGTKVPEDEWTGTVEAANFRRYQSEVKIVKKESQDRSFDSFEPEKFADPTPDQAPASPPSIHEELRPPTPQAPSDPEIPEPTEQPKPPAPESLPQPVPSFVGIKNFTKFVNETNRKRQLSAAFAQKLTKQVQVQREGLFQSIERRLNAHGNSLFGTVGRSQDYAELCRSMDRDRPVYFPFTFSPTSLSAEEKIALKQNFYLHKNLMRILFNRFAHKATIKVTQADQTVVDTPSVVLSVSQFILLARSLGAAYQQVDHLKCVKLFKYVNSRFAGGAHLKSEILFSQFRLLVTQFAYMMHSGPFQEYHPFVCFEKFLENVKRSTDDPLAFENDEMLAVNVDKRVVAHFQEILRREADVPLPPNLRLKRVTEFYTEPTDPQPPKKESRRVVEWVIRDILMAAFDISFVPAVIQKTTYQIVVQDKPIDFKYKEAGEGHPSGDLKTSRVVPEEGVPSKAPDGNDFLHRKRLKMVSNPIEGLPVPLKLLIMNSPENDKSTLIDVAHLLEHLVKKVEVLATAQKPVELDNKTGRILNTALIGRERRSSVPQSDALQRYKSLKLVYRSLKRKISAKKGAAANTKPENFLPKLQVQKRTAELFPEKIKKIENFRAEKRTQKEQTEAENQRKNQEFQEEILKLVAKFKEKSVPKLKNAIKEAEKVGKKRVEKVNKSLHLPKLPKISSQTTHKLQSDHEVQKENQQTWEGHIKELWASIEVRNAFSEWTASLRRLFQSVADQFGDKTVASSLEALRPVGSWGFRETLQFCKEAGIYPGLMSQGDVKHARRKALELTNNGKHFAFEQFKHFLIQVFVKIKSVQGWTDFTDFDPSLFHQMLRDLHGRRLDQFLSKVRRPSVPVQSN